MTSSKKSRVEARAKVAQMLAAQVRAERRRIVIAGSAVGGSSSATAAVTSALSHVPLRR